MTHLGCQGGAEVGGIFQEEPWGLAALTNMACLDLTF